MAVVRDWPMRLRWALAHRRQSSIKLQVPVSIRAFRPYESQSATCPTCSDQGEIRTPKPIGARRSERRVSTSCTTWSCCWKMTRAGFEPASPA